MMVVIMNTVLLIFLLVMVSFCKEEEFKTLTLDTFFENVDPWEPPQTAQSPPESGQKAGVTKKDSSDSLVPFAFKYPPPPRIPNLEPKINMTSVIRKLSTVSPNNRDLLHNLTDDHDRLLRGIEERIKTLDAMMEARSINTSFEYIPRDILRLAQTADVYEQRLHPYTYTQGMQTRFTDRKYQTSLACECVHDPTGMAFSRIHKDVLYVINDAGSDNDPDINLYLYNAVTGEPINSLEVLEAYNYKWDAMAVAPCRSDRTRSCIYIGDLAGQPKGAPGVDIYIFEEPRDLDSESIIVKEVINVDQDFKFSSHAMMVSPEAEIFIITHGQGQTTSKQFLYQIIDKQAIFLCEVPMNSNWVEPHDAVISSSGTMVLLKSLESVYFSYVPDGNYKTICNCGQITKQQYTLENDDYDFKPNAITFSPDELAYFTLQQGSYAPLYRYDRLKVSELGCGRQRPVG